MRRELPNALKKCISCKYYNNKTKLCKNKNSTVYGISKNMNDTCERWNV